MLNTGTLFEKPYESGYGRFCRFLNANLGTDTSNKRIGDEFERVFQKKCVNVPSGEFERAYKSSCLEQNRYLPLVSTFKHNGYSLRSGYRPTLHCPDCARNNYHSYIFELPWVSICPIHYKELESHCPDCGGRWLPGSQLTRHNCKTCGVGLPFEKWVELNSIDEETYRAAFSSHLELRELINSKLFPVFGVHGIDHYGMPKLVYFNHAPGYQTDALRLVGLLPEKLHQYFQVAYPHQKEIESVCLLDNEYYAAGKQHKKLIYSPIKIDFSKLRSKTKAAFEALIDHSHQLGDCSFKDEICVFCGAWNAWQQVYRSEHNVEWYPQLKNWASSYTNIRNYRAEAVSPLIMGRLATIDNKDILLPNQLVDKLNFTASLRFLVNLLIQLFFHGEYLDKYPEPNQDAYRDMLDKLYWCAELQSSVFGCIRHKSETTIYWPKIKLPSYIKNIDTVPLISE